MDIHQWLTATTAGDVQTTKVKTLRPTDTLAAAARLFLDEQITGAPVVDSEGRCVGVLSVTDVTRAEKEIADVYEELASTSIFHAGLALPIHLYEDALAEVRDKIKPAVGAACRPFQRVAFTHQ